MGGVNVKEQGFAFVELIELARAIRGKLGCRKYLLDQYLLQLLKMARNFSYLDLSDDGEEAGGQLRKLCRQAVRGDAAVGETRIGSTVQAYVATHPYSNLLREVGLDKKIQTLPKGMDTSVYKEFDEDGFEPSGGEGQKVAIARAIARKSDIVILDEPLSALDPKAEHEIFQQFDAMIRNKTAIYISHRLSSSRLCDYIAVFQAGHIIEYGTHDELISLDGKYAELYNLQAQYYVDKRVV